MTADNSGNHSVKTRIAGVLCSNCGLCLTSHVNLAREACAFVCPQITRLEKSVHGCSREPDNFDHQYFGIYRFMETARMVRPIEDAQWTGVISHTACEMLRLGMVDAVICAHSAPDNPLKPVPFLAKTRAEVLAGRGNKPMLSPNLSLLDRAREEGVKRLLFIGVGCHVQALRSVEDKPNFEKIYVLGLPCVDNSTPEALKQSLQLSSKSPDTVLKFEFMQDYYVQFTHKDRSVERVSMFALKSRELLGFIHTSCKSCFDYVNSLADLVIGYMGSPIGWQWIIVRNDAGNEMLDVIQKAIESQPVQSKGNRRPISQMMPYVLAHNFSLPGWAAEIMGAMVNRIGPKGLEFARLSIDMHFIRNYLFLTQDYPEYRAKLMPEFALKILNQYITCHL